MSETESINSINDKKDSDDIDSLPFEIIKESETQVKRLLFRSRDDYMIAGVLGGLAYYWKMDSTLLRFLFLLISLLTGGLSIIAYLILMKAIPIEPEEK